MPRRRTEIVLANSRSGSFNRLWGSIEPMFRRRATVFTPDTFGQLDRDIARIAEMQPDYIWLCGGDGSQHQYLTRIADQYRRLGIDLPQIIILHTGTMGIADKSLRTNRRSVPERVRRIHAAMDTGQGFKKRLFRPMLVNGECAFICGAGLPVAFLERYYEFKEEYGTSGDVSSVLTMGSVVWNEIFLELGLEDNSNWMARLLEALDFRQAKDWINFVLNELGMAEAAAWHSKDMMLRVSEPGQEWRGQSGFVRCTGFVCSSIEQIGHGIKAFPGAMDHGGDFTVVTTQLPFMGVALAAPLILARLPVPDMDRRVMRDAVLEFDRDIKYMVDGDIKPAVRKLTFGVGPTFEIIVE